MNDYIVHYGKLGMKRGVRKSKTSKGSSKKSSIKFKTNKVNEKINKVLTDSRKQKLKQLEKSAARVAGTVAAAATLGSLGVIGMNSIHREMNYNNLGNISKRSIYIDNKLSEKISDKYKRVYEDKILRHPSEDGEYVGQKLSELRKNPMD